MVVPATERTQAHRVSVPKVGVFGKNAVERRQQRIGVAITLRFLHGVAEHPLGFGRRKLWERLDPHFFRLCQAANKNRLGVRFRDTALRVLLCVWPVSVCENGRKCDKQGKEDKPGRTSHWVPVMTAVCD